MIKKLILEPTEMDTFGLWLIWILHCKYHSNLNSQPYCCHHLPNGSVLHNSILLCFHVSSQFPGISLTFGTNTNPLISSFNTFILNNIISNYLCNQCRQLAWIWYSFHIILFLVTLEVHCMPFLNLVGCQNHFLKLNFDSNCCCVWRWKFPFHQS